MGCIILSDLALAHNCADLDNRGGIVSRIILGYIEDVATFPDLPAASGSSGNMSFAEAGMLDGSLAMKTGKRMYQINFIDGTGEITIAPAGEPGARCVKYAVAFDFAKNGAEKFGFLNAIKDQPIVVLVEDKNGTKYLLGDKLCPCKLADGDGGTSGKGVTESNKLTVNLEYYGPRFLVYDGSLDTLLVTAGSST